MENTTTEVREFGIKDSKGRTLGGKITLGVYVVEDADNAKWLTERTGSPVAIGQTLYTFRPSAMRDGAEFGAIARKSYFATVEARAAHASKYWAQAAKRASKNAVQS